MEKSDIIKEILNTLNQQNNVVGNQSTYSFKNANGNNSISIIGNEKLATYNNLYEQLGKEYKIKDLTISLKSLKRINISVAASRECLFF